MKRTESSNEAFQRLFQWFFKIIKRHDKSNLFLMLKNTDFKPQFVIGYCSRKNSSMTDHDKKSMLHKKATIAILLFTAIFLIIGAPWSSWWFFESDEFDAVYRAFKSQSLKKPFTFFFLQRCTRYAP